MDANTSKKNYNYFMGMKQALISQGLLTRWTSQPDLGNTSGWLERVVSVHNIPNGCFVAYEVKVNKDQEKVKFPEFFFSFLNGLFRDFLIHGWCISTFFFWNFLKVEII